MILRKMLKLTPNFIQFFYPYSLHILDCQTVRRLCPFTFLRFTITIFYFYDKRSIFIMFSLNTFFNKNLLLIANLLKCVIWFLIGNSLPIFNQEIFVILCLLIKLRKSLTVVLLFYFEVFHKVLVTKLIPHYYEVKILSIYLQNYSFLATAHHCAEPLTLL